jgi:adenylyltransferase/sulfurtransferase
VFPEANAARTPACADGGVLPPLAGAIGCLQANEVIKLITGTGELLAGKLLLYNSLDSTSRIIKTGNKSRISVTALATDHITQLTLTEWQQQPDTFYLVDVRTPAEHAAGNLGGINIPLAELNASHLAAITQPILFYCATGKRSMEAARLLQGTPGVEIYTLAGGIPDQ